MDVQELSVTLTSERSLNEVKLVSDPYKISFINFNAANIFMEQQKWYSLRFITLFINQLIKSLNKTTFYVMSKRKLYKLVKTSEHASYDEIQEPDELNSPLTYNDVTHKFLHSKIVATCFVARK